VKCGGNIPLVCAIAANFVDVRVVISDDSGCAGSVFASKPLKAKSLAL
jgi:hypothetical protein